MRPHLLQDERSRAIHRLIAERIQAEPRLLEMPRARVSQWLATGSTHAYYATAWAELLDGPLDRLVAVLLDPGENAVALRHVSPFGGIIDMTTRARIWREVRERLLAQQTSVEARH